MFKPYFFILLLTGIVISCEKNNEPTPDDSDDTKIDLPVKSYEIITISNNFGIELFTRVATEEEDANMMLSPLSASVALTMLLNGCDGDTYTQIRDMLGYSEDLSIEEINKVYNSLVSQLLEADSKVTMALANAVFYRQGFQVKAKFLNTMADEFKATIEDLDFDDPSAVDIINQWASDNTEEKITEVIEEIDPLTVMFLMNAMYFKGDWTYQFDESETTDRSFYLEDGTSVEVPTMSGKIKTKYLFEDSYRAIDLPYGKNNFSMTVIVPNSKLNEFYKDFTPEQWNSIVELFDALDNPDSISVYMPKFKIEYEKTLNDQLKSMGMIDAFDGSAADLSGIADLSDVPQNLFVSFVKQNTFIEVNEEGTEAAAVTTIAIDVTSINGSTSFYVNKPYIFAIREKTTNTLLFIGAVKNPEG